MLTVFFCAAPLAAAETLRFTGEYFLFSDDHDYLYGGGKITVKGGGVSVTGDVIYMDVKKLTGVIYGDVRMTRGEDKEEKKYDALFFKGVPPQWLTVSYEDQLVVGGESALKTGFTNFAKKTPEQLKDSSLYFEFREFRIDKNGKIKARIVVPYMMGLPTVPLKRFTVNRGEWAEKTMLAFNNINYTGLDGLSVSLFLRMRAKWLKGDYDLKLYERKFFKLDGIKRGALFSGKSSLLINKKEILNYSVLLNSGEKSFNLRLNHRNDFKLFSYSFSQNISGREKQQAFSEFSSDITIKKLKLFVPRFYFSHDWKKSYSYRVSTPLKLWKKLNLNASWQRKILKGNFQSDTSDFSTSLGFNTNVFALTSNYNFSKNLLEATVRKNFSVNMTLIPLRFLEDNISIVVSSVYMFSELPYGDQVQKRVSPGVTVRVNSLGVAMPLGFELVPAFTFNHLWDNQQESFTDFNYSVALQKEIGIFTGSVAYSLASRYRAENFWIEGNNRQNMNVNFQFKDRDDYSFLLRFYFNNSLAMENISFTGKMNLPLKLTFSSFLLYYNEDNKFRTVEVFIEKVFKNKIRIQGGYSLSLKRFFIKFLSM